MKKFLLDGITGWPVSMKGIVHIISKNKVINEDFNNITIINNTDNVSCSSDNKLIKDLFIAIFEDINTNKKIGVGFEYFLRDEFISKFLYIFGKDNTNIYFVDDIIIKIYSIIKLEYNKEKSVPIDELLNKYKVIFN